MDFKINRAGTKYLSKQDGTLLYECQYCETWFEPTTKFKQKYCSESCRVMACRERNNGVGGIYAGKRSQTSNTDLLRQLKAIRKDSEDALLKSTDSAFNSLLDRQHKTDLRMSDEIRKLRIDLNRRMDWLMLIAAIAPVVSPAVVNWFRQVALGEKPKEDKILDELAGLREKLDEKTKEELRKLLEEQELMHIADLML